MGMGMGMDPFMLEVMLPEDGFIPDPIPIPIDIDMVDGRADGCKFYRNSLTVLLHVVVSLISILRSSDADDGENALFFVNSKRARNQI